MLGGGNVFCFISPHSVSHLPYRILKVFQNVIILHYLFLRWRDIREFSCIDFLSMCGISSSLISICWPSASGNLTFKWKPSLYSLLLVGQSTFLITLWDVLPDPCILRKLLQVPLVISRFSSSTSYLHQSHHGSSGPSSCVSD